MNLALTTQAIIVGFNVRAEAAAKRLAEKEGVEITDNKINTDNNKKSVIIVNNKVQSNVNKILVEKGWNLIGTKDTISLDTQHIEDNLIYLYDNGYKLVRTLFPGNGYWIKSKIDGYINFTIN